ncbi:asparagine synthase (glutamine-hydrolyzing) [Longispora sp. NPDC051575]|uniref:asparagine synthase (glutamine-hydrolyzing) n=1 Tax=Longispora sp. NPDC051575 TaxID=3154943 RepID=UPI00342D9522
MCGITGYTSWAVSPLREPQVIAAMTDTLLRRGPDDHAVIVGQDVAFGHARLSVIDIDGGRQPMTAIGRHGGLIMLVFSGEIYNFRDLREQLRQLGHHFHTSSDTEVVLRAWIEWGPKAPEKFVGMFAFGVWDDALRTLWLVRDQIGIKPLYYARTGDGGVVFGSELKAILQHPRVEAAVDAHGVAELFALAPNSSPGHAILAGIEELRPGHMAVAVGRGLSVRRYWRWTPREHPDDLAATIDTVRGLLAEAVDVQLRADREVGALLSGGLDSSAVAALAGVDGLRTYAVDYAEGGEYGSSGLHRSSDTPYAEAMARHLGSRHVTHLVSVADLAAAGERTLRAMDVPSYPAINAPLVLLCERISQDVRVVLSGEGADESFGGYHWHQPDDAEPDTFPWARSYKSMDYLLRPDVARIVQPAAYRQARYQDALAEVPHLPGERGQARRMRELHHLTDEYYLQFLLRRVDRMSMSTGVEVRVPFLHLPLVEYARSIPWQWRRQGGLEKGLLRRAVEDVLPERIAWRPKSGFPVAQSLASQTQLWATARALLADTGAPVWQIVDPAAVDWLLQHAEGRLEDWSASLHLGHVLEWASFADQHKVRLT